ncbi:MAG: isopentenyl phosphate kinase [Candidatus Thorarchaeota archaeon]
MAQELTVLKLGGALITVKSKPYTSRPKIIDSVSREIKDCMDEGLIQSLVIVQGVGSYGHPPVLEHKLYKGYHGEDQRLPLSWTQSKVNELRTMVLNSLYNAEIPVCLIHPSSMMVSEKTKITKHYLEPLERYSALGMVILIGGDILTDSVMGWSVGSGDALTILIARELGAKRVIFASDVNGIYDSDPKLNPDANLFNEINLNDIDDVLEKMGASGVVDASGAMKGKLSSIEPIKDMIENGLDLSILSMMESGNLMALLKGDKSKSTQIVVK